MTGPVLTAELLADRAVIGVSGAEARAFLDRRVEAVGQRFDEAARA